MSGYGSIELGQPGNPAIPDQYTPDSTLLAPQSEKCLIQVSLQGVFVQFGKTIGKGGGLGNVVWEQEEPLLPLTMIRNVEFDAVRVRNYTPGHPGQVLITPLT
jgi:hypothetical protein